jgi:hypothetical protein
MVNGKQIVAAALALSAVVAVPIGASAQTPEKRVALSYRKRVHGINPTLT